ncbi:MAG: efflux RND transporter periplasmic adaptor subunit, partial [Puniceicoccaceae bacterium]
MPFRPNPTSESSTTPVGGRRQLLLLPALCALLLLAGCAEPSGGSGEEGQRESPPPEVGYIEVRPRSLDRLETLPGRVVAYEVAEIRPQVGGIILSRHFEEGAYVEEGQRLYQIDPARYEADHEMAQADLENAEARRLSAEALADRAERLIESEAVSEQEHIEAISDFEQSKAAIRMARAEVGRARINLEYTEVRAPISGYISPSSVTRGALVTEGQATPLATVRQLDPVYVDLSQSDEGTDDLRERLVAARLADDGRDTFSVRLFPPGADEPYPHEGTLDVAELAVDPRTGAIRLRTTFPNPDKALLPGMFVRASVEAADRREEIVIPQKSVTIGPDDERSVWVVDSEDRARKRSIRTGGTY